MKKITTILILPILLLAAPDRPKPKLPPELKARAEAIHDQVKTGELTHEQAKQKLKQLSEDNKPDKKKPAKDKPEKTDKPKVDRPKPDDKKRPRPELSDELKQKVAELKQKRETLAAAHKELRDKLKEASTEDREALIKEFKETNKEQHEAIKQQSKQIKQEIRETIETGVKRTSDI